MLFSVWVRLHLTHSLKGHQTNTGNKTTWLWFAAFSIGSALRFLIFVFFIYSALAAWTQITFKLINALLSHVIDLHKLFCTICSNVWLHCRVCYLKTSGIADAFIFMLFEVIRVNLFLFTTQLDEWISWWSFVINVHWHLSPVPQFPASLPAGCIECFVECGKKALEH